jgi:hypothetical protein
MLNFEDVEERDGVLEMVLILMQDLTTKLVQVCGCLGTYGHHHA